MDCTFYSNYLTGLCIYMLVNSTKSFTSVFLGTAEALAKQVTQENFDKGMIYPPFSNIRKISSQIAANVAAKAYELGEFLFTEFTVPAILHNSSLKPH